MKISCACWLSLALVLTGCITSPPYIEGDLGAIAPRLSGDLKRENSSGNHGSSASFGDLGLDDREFSPYLAVRGGAFGFNGSLSYFQSSFDGNGTIDNDFGDIGAGTKVDSSLDLIEAKLAVTLTLLSLGPVRFAGGAGIEHIDFDVDVDGQGGAGKEKFSSISDVPILVGEGELELGPLRVLASLSGVPGEYGDVDGPLV